MTKALVLGEICIDVILNNPASVPVLGKNVWAESIQMRLGGSATYVSQGLQVLGIPTTVNSVVGEDPLIEVYLNQLQYLGIDISHVHRQPSAATSVCIGVVDKGKKSFIGCSPFLKYPDHLLEINPEEFDLVYFGGYLLYPEIWDGKLSNLLQKVRPDAHTILDTQMLPIPVDLYRDRAITKSLLEQVEVLLVDRKEAIALTKRQNPEEAARILADYGPKIITVKLGGQGCLVLTQGEILKSKSLKVDARDLIGAGDFFGAAFSYGVLMGWPLQKTADFANGFAALCAARKESNALPELSLVLKHIFPSAIG